MTKRRVARRSARSFRASPLRSTVLAIAGLVSLCVLTGAESALARSDEASAPLAARDFATGWTLVGARDRLLQSVLLDYDVYRASVEPGLADLRVFDATGSPTPYAIRRDLARRDTRERSAALPLFALDAPSLTAGSDAGTATAEGRGGDYRIRAEVSPDGAIVNVERGQPGAARPAGAWLLDASGVDGRIVELAFEVAPSASDHLIRLRVESSSDLTQWRTVDSEIVLARLSQGGHRIERSTFAIPSTRSRYLRVTPLGPDPGIALEGVTATVRIGAPRPPRLRHRLEGEPHPDRPGVVEYDLHGLPPIDRVRVLLPEPGTIVEARLESASSPESAWTPRWNGLLYAIERDGLLRNGAVAWHGGDDRRIRLVTSERGGGLRGQLPTLEIEWPAEQLLYVDRGRGASTLAVGRVDTPDGSFAERQLIKIAGTGAPPDATAQLGAPRVLAGEAATVRVEPIPWRTYGLWLLLLVSVAAVLGMSVRLMRAG